MFLIKCQICYKDATFCWLNCYLQQYLYKLRFSSMNLFEQNWISSAWVDLEYKRYMFLSYLQKVEQKFMQSKVYPYLSVIRSEHENLIELKEQIELFSLQHQMLSGEEHFQISNEIETLIKISDFALPRLYASIQCGEEIEQLIVNELEFKPVGLLPVNRSEGYLIFRHDALARIYRFQLRRIAPSQDSETYTHQLKTWFVQHSNTGKYRISEDLKFELIKAHRDLPNPATYSINSNLKLPYTETLVPIGRKLLYRFLND